MLSDLVDKKKGYRKAENTSDNESNNEESLSDIENQEGEEEEEEKAEVASESGVEDDSQESDNDTENDSRKTESSSLETSTTFHAENYCEHCENSKVYGTLIMKCPKCFWHVITTRFVLYAITRSHQRGAVFGVTIVERLHTKNAFSGTLRRLKSPKVTSSRLKSP